MVIDNLKLILTNNNDINNQEYLRNLLKEELQILVLNFVYTNQKYKNFIFTGGTCLRKFFSLGRLSEDLDFDIEDEEFNMQEFADDLIDYFKSRLQYKKAYFKLNNKTVFLKLPVLREIGYARPNDSEILILRIDFANSYSKSCITTPKIFDSLDYSFVARTYDFSTLTANKIVAFLTRIYKRGKYQEINFKGRDAFDISWMLEKITSEKLSINTIRVKEFIKIKDLDELKEMIIKKSKLIDSKDLYNDLKNFFKEDAFVKDFCDNFQSLIKSSLKHISEI